jgi:hypothetical protein
VEPVAASPSCPRCGAESRAGAGRCARCGFALLDAPGRRRGRPGGRPRTPRRVGRRSDALAAAAALAAAVLAAAGRDDRAPEWAAPGAGRDARSPGAASGPSPVPVSAVRAERQLELGFATASHDESAAVRCPQAIGPERMVRCELRYAASAPRPLLVRLSPRGKLEAVVPAAATLKR